MYAKAKTAAFYAAAFLTGATLAYCTQTAAAAPPRQTPQYQAQPPQYRPQYRAYDCDTVGQIPIDAYFDEAAAHQIARLRQECKQQRAAAVLAKIWEEDPQAGEVR